jgi:hypothetical protein
MYSISENHDLTIRIFFAYFWNQSHDLSPDYEFKFEHILVKTFSQTLRNQATLILKAVYPDRADINGGTSLQINL